MRKKNGFTLFELLVVMAVIATLATLVYPAFIRGTSHLRLKMAASQMARYLAQARLYAVHNNVFAAIKFRTYDDGTVTVALYRDGDGDGVRNKDITSGDDPVVWDERRVNYFNCDVQIAIPKGRAPRHPGNPSKRLDRLDDPIRFNRSDLASFSPYGKATPGSIYISNAYYGLMAVRTYHRNGDITVVSYDYEAETWEVVWG